MKIISWNVNGLRAVHRKDMLLPLIKNEKPDLLMLQEIKCSDAEFDKIMDDISASTDGAYMGEAIGSTISGRHGVAIIYRIDPEDPADVLYDGYSIKKRFDPVVGGIAEARVMGAILFGETLFINSYSVNVRSDLSRIPERLELESRLQELVVSWHQNCQAQEMPTQIVLVGDLNVVSQPIDYHGAMNPTVSGMTPEERGSFQKLLEAGMVDAFRHKYPDRVKYSYWSYRANARERNQGWRIDHTLVSNDLVDKIIDADVLMHYYGSDHAPVMLEIDIELE